MRNKMHCNVFFFFKPQGCALCINKCEHDFFVCWQENTSSCSKREGIRHQMLGCACLTMSSLGLFFLLNLKRLPLEPCKTSYANDSCARHCYINIESNPLQTTCFYPTKVERICWAVWFLEMWSYFLGAYQVSVAFVRFLHVAFGFLKW